MKTIVVKGTGSVVASQVLEAKGFKALGAINPDYPCREYFRNKDGLVGYMGNFATKKVWQGKDVFLSVNE